MVWSWTEAEAARRRRTKHCLGRATLRAFVVSHKGLVAAGGGGEGGGGRVKAAHGWGRGGRKGGERRWGKEVGEEGASLEAFQRSAAWGGKCAFSSPIVYEAVLFCHFHCL